MEPKLQTNEVNIGSTKIGPDTVIQLNLKTLVIVLGFLLSGLTTAWWNLSDSINKSNDSSAEDIKELQYDIKELKNQDLKTISIQLNQLDGKVQGIFMNMQRHGYNSAPGATHAGTPSNMTPANPN